MICATLANINRDPKKRKKPFEVADFMPKSGKKKAPQTWQSHLKVAEMLNAAFGGKDKRSEKLQQVKSAINRG